jgi:ribosomal protein S18 acetylase RimI-like enzyme
VVTIAPATPSDAPAVIALWEACALTRSWNDPQADYTLALETPTSAIFLSRDGDTITGSIMVGFDGHRGWVYYLAVALERRRAGVGRDLMAAAEIWLNERNAPKIQLMVREDNAAAMGFYAALGYAVQPVSTLGKWLDHPS